MEVEPQRPEEKSTFTVLVTGANRFAMDFARFTFVESSNDYKRLGLRNMLSLDR